MKKNIGILGATGLVGSSVLSALQGKGYALLIGARNQYKLQCLKEEFSTENIEIIQMDVFIPKQVEMFCSQCDVVINCTSPASIVGTRIVRECIKQGNDYIDPFGEGDVEKYIVDNKSMIGDKKTRIILSSGTYPGLSEALFKYVAEIHKGAEVCLLNMRVTGIPYRGMFVRWWQNGA